MVFHVARGGQHYCKIAVATVVWVALAASAENEALLALANWTTITGNPSSLARHQLSAGSMSSLYLQKEERRVRVRTPHLRCSDGKRNRKKGRHKKHRALHLSF